MLVRLPRAPFLYPILDTDFSEDPFQDARKIIRAGAEILQLRAKNLTKRAIYDLVLEIVPLCHEKQVCFLLNDWVDITLVTPISGVHLGQEDFPVDQARKLMKKKIIGLSTHTTEQYSIALGLPIDYIAVGPVYETATKQSLNKTLGISGISALLKKKVKPVVAIGGIRQEHFAALLAAGIDGIALISQLYQHGDLYDTTSRLLDAISR